MEGRGYDEERMQATGARTGGPDVGSMYGGGYGPWGGYGRGRGMDRPIETKPFFLTSEFFGTLLAIVAMAIAAASDDGFDARLFWILTTALVFGYVLSRGIAKSGTKSRATDPREEMRLFGGGGGRGE